MYCIKGISYLKNSHCVILTNSIMLFIFNLLSQNAIKESSLAICRLLGLQTN